MMASTLPVRFKGLDIRQRTYANGNGYTLELHTPLHDSQDLYAASLKKFQPFLPYELHAKGNGEVVFQYEQNGAAGRTLLKTLPYDVFGGTGQPKVTVSDNAPRWTDEGVEQLTEAMIREGKAPTENTLREVCTNAVKRFIPEPWRTELLAFMPTSRLSVDIRHKDPETGTVFHYDKEGQLRQIQNGKGDNLIYDSQGELVSVWWGYRSDRSEPQVPVEPPKKWNPDTFNPETDRIDVVLGTPPMTWEDH